MKLDLIHITTHSEEIFYRLRWGECIHCPECGSVHIYNPEAGQLHICADCDHRFSDTSGTAFHSTKLPLAKWLIAIYMFCTQSKGISSYNLARMISVSQPTAWRMLTILRLNIQHDLQLTDVTLLDELYLGPQYKWKPYHKKHKIPKEEQSKYTYQELKMIRYKEAAKDKFPILGIYSGSLSLHILPNPVTRSAIYDVLTREYNIGSTSTIVTDQSTLYDGLDEEFGLIREVCNHGKHSYRSKNGYSSNRLEGAFSHIRRMFHGIYNRCSFKYLQQYLDEFLMRYNWRNVPIHQRISDFFPMLIS